MCATLNKSFQSHHLDSPYTCFFLPQDWQCLRKAPSVSLDPHVKRNVALLKAQLWTFWEGIVTPGKVARSWGRFQRSWHLQAVCWVPSPYLGSKYFKRGSRECIPTSITPHSPTAFYFLLHKAVNTSFPKMYFLAISLFKALITFTCIWFGSEHQDELLLVFWGIYMTNNSTAPVSSFSYF